MKANFLSLNDEKSEIVWFSSRFKKAEMKAPSTEVRIGVCRYLHPYSLSVIWG